MNLLDNSNFGNLIAQAGLGAWNETDKYTSGLHGSTAYAADRWTNYTGSVEQHDGYARIYAGMSSCRIAQVMQNVAGKTVTVAAKVVGSNKVYIGIYYTIDGTTNTGSVATSVIAPNGIICKTGTVPSNAINIQFRIYPAYEDSGNNYADVYWAALYEGAYANETLPPYVPKPYSVELAECQRYYENSWFPQTKSMRTEHVASVWAANSSMDAIYKYKQTKYRIPTVAFYPGPTTTTGKWQYYLGGWFDIQGTVTAVTDRDLYNQLTVRITRGEDTINWAAGSTIQVLGHWEAVADILE